MRLIMDDTERLAAFKIIDTFKNAPELKLDSSRFNYDDEFEQEELELELENPKGT